MDIFDVIETTWPAAATHVAGPWKIRDGQGGGKRVSSVEWITDHFDADDLDHAEDALRALGQDALFMIRPEHGVLDAALAARGYEIIDPVNIYQARATDIATERPPRVSMFCVWPRLAIQENIWTQGGIGPKRWDVMDRAIGPKTTIVGRWDDQPAATAYVALCGATSMLHALEVLPHQRQKGVARNVMRQAAFWTLEQGGTDIAVVCVKTNTGANALYSSLGMELISSYHYRIKRDRT